MYPAMCNVFWYVFVCVCVIARSVSVWSVVNASVRLARELAIPSGVSIDADFMGFRGRLT